MKKKTEQLTIDNSQLTIKEEEPGLGETEEHTPSLRDTPLDRGDESGRRDWEGIGDEIQNEFYGLCSVLVSKIKDFRCDNEKTGLDGMIKTTESMAKLILSIENLKTELWLKDNERAIIEKSFNDLKNEDLSEVLQNYLMYMEMIGEE